jgi:hypothetical protein
VAPPSFCLTNKTRDFFFNSFSSWSFSNICLD